jgi:hypothetical protein
VILVSEFDQFLTSLCFHPVLGLYHCCVVIWIFKEPPVPVCSCLW